jgi:cell division septum initiation protein DivIVA
MDINAVLEENKLLKQRVNELEEKLKSYTNPERNKKYYENNKDKFIEKRIQKKRIFKKKRKDKK